MKKLFVLAITLMWGSLFLTAQQNQVPLETIKEIADRNAKALWGNIYPDEPIPYYSAQEEIIAYMFNYSIAMPFPEGTSIIGQCKTHKENNNRNLQWGGDTYGRILMGASESLPVIIEYSKSLSAKYAEGYKLRELALKELGNNFSLQKIYYINGANQWFCYSNGKKTIYIKLFPPVEVLTRTDFEEAIADKNVFIQPADYSMEWASYKSGKELDSKADNFIPDYELCRFYDWSYGCSPTAAAMLYSWWDYRSLYSDNDFGRLIKFYFKRYDTKEVEWDYQIPGVQKELAIYMNTDTLTGNTNFYNINDGIEDVAVNRGYEFDADDYISFEWTRLKGEIDDNRPLIASIPNHSTCCIGYNTSDHFANHYTHQGNIVWTHKDELDGVVEVKPESNDGQGITLTYPVGDPNYNATGNGEIFYPGEIYGITWEYESSISSVNTIYYSTNGSGILAEDVIVPETPNDGYYAWTVPAGIGSDECRIGINNINASYDLLGIDCSMGMFTIYSPPTIPELSSGYEQTTDYDPDYFKFEHDDNSWCVVGIRNMYGVDWKLKLYSDISFLTLIAESNMPAEESEVDFIVIDGNHTSTTMRGIKVDMVDGDNSAKVMYEGGIQSVSLGTQNITLPVGSVSEMYDVHLVPGYYTFMLNPFPSSDDADIALFSSTGGSYIQSLDDAIALSNVGGWGEEETFTVFIDTEDDYGFCLWTSSPSPQTWELEIIEEHPGIWEGDYNSYWSSSQNWSLNIVPDVGTDVVIPAGTPYTPYVLNPAFCNNIIIESGATLRVSSSYLVAGGDMLIKGYLRIYENEYISVNGDITWTSTSSQYIGNNASINIGEDWTFDYGCSIQMNEGKVRFAGIEHSMIYCRSNNSWFNDVEVDKLLSTALVSYEMTPGLQALRIYGDFNGIAGKFFCPSWDDVYFKGTYLNMVDDFIFYCTNGSFIFNGSSNQHIYFNANSYFCSLVIESSGNVYIHDPIVIEESLTINSGVLASNSHTIEIGGSWRNNVGVGAFWQSSGTVVFNGYGTRECDGEEFHILELNKSSGELRFHEGVTECDTYNYTQGTIRVNGGSFTADDLTDSGIFGTIIITAGDLTFHQDESQFIDLRCDLTMTDGTFTIYGGGDNSYWPYMQNASITMSGGTLDIVDNGIRVHGTNYSLTENITGGRIRTAYGFDIYRDDFTPSGGIIELYGPSDESVIISGTSYFHDLQINKSTKNYSPNIYPKKPRHKEQQKGTKASSITANSNLDINGDFIISAGTFDAPGKMFVAGNWQNNAGSSAFIEGIDTVYIDGNADQYCNFEMFYNLILIKSGGEFILNADDVFVTNYDWASGHLHVNGGGFIVSDLVDNGIYGTITLTSGLIEFNQGSTTGEYVDLNGHLTINGGYMIIHGGSIDSYWPYMNDASLTINNGVLDFQTVGIYVYNSAPWSFTENITGGTIKTSQDFRGNRTDFTPTGGIVELYGPDDAQLSMGAGSNLHNLVVDKSSKKNNYSCTQTESRMENLTKGSKANQLSLTSNIDVNGYFVLQESTINFNGYQGKFESDVQVTSNGIMELDDNSELMLASGSNATFKSGAIFEAIGSSGNEALVTSESGFYNFTISTGGTIRAEHTIFENMSSNGIHVNAGGLVDLAYPFTNCTFQNGENIIGSSLLTIDNNQLLIINNVSFPALMAGGPCNVSKTENQGEITFIDPTGPFCGCIYEDDPYDRINWESSAGYYVALTALLEGPFDGTGMTTYLNEENLIPLTQPYSSPPWNYSGTESVATIPPNVVDWVLLELRDASGAATATGSRVFARKAAFMLKNGYIVDLDGASSIYFNDIFNQDMYTVVYHRNHLGVLSANPATFSGGKYSYNFTTGMSQVYGGNAGHNQLATGYWGLFGGNGVVDEQIDDTDRINGWNPHSGSSGYLMGDFNLDGQVNNPDKNDIWIENNGNSSQIPD